MNGDKERRNAEMPTFDAVTTLDMIRLVRSGRIKAEYGYVAAETMTDEIELALFRMEDKLLGLLLKDEDKEIAQRSGNSD